MPEEPTKLDEEIASFIYTVKNAGTFLRYSVHARAPPMLTKPIDAVMNDDRTQILFLGICLESAGIAIQMALGFPVYPILDAITAFIVVLVVVWYQRRKRNVEKPTDQT